MNKILVSSALFLGTAVAGFTLISPQVEAEDQAAAEVQQPTHEFITVESSSVTGNIVLGGSVQPAKTVNLSAQMPGDVLFIAGQEGDSFKRGDQLVALDTAALLAKRKQAETQYYSAEAGYRNAMVQYNREVQSPNSQANSMMGGAPSMFSMFSDPFRDFTGEGDSDIERHSNLYQYNVGVQTARNQMEQALAAIAELDENLKNAVSYAPFDGVIIKKMIEEGDIVQPGMPLVTFADITKLEIRVEVPTNLLHMIRDGDSLQARLDGSNKLIPVTISRIYPSADAAGHTTTVKFSLDDSSLARSGMYAEVMIPDPAKKGISSPVVPETAILWRGSLPAVYKLDESGMIKLRLIRIGERTAEGKVIVISGIRVGDKILAEPGAGTRSGS
jgi:multidrug efflux pump subunit AcrA (membrane-fusion protein)